MDFSPTSFFYLLNFATYLCINLQQLLSILWTHYEFQISLCFSWPITLVFHNLYFSLLHYCYLMPLTLTPRLTQSMVATNVPFSHFPASTRLLLLYNCCCAEIVNSLILSIHLIWWPCWTMTALLLEKNLVEGLTRGPHLLELSSHVLNLGSYLEIMCLIPFISLSDFQPLDSFQPSYMSFTIPIFKQGSITNFLNM